LNHGSAFDHLHSFYFVGSRFTLEKMKWTTVD
jgi:hypothetical protein